jgi:hypothetical protein
VAKNTMTTRTLGARWLFASAILWFLLAPFAVWAHVPMVLAGAAFQSLGTWLFAARDRDDPRPYPARWALALRALAVLEVAVVATSTLAYRAILIADVAVRFGYMARIGPDPEPSRRRTLNGMALVCSVCFALASGDWLAHRAIGPQHSWLPPAASFAALAQAIWGWMILGEIGWERAAPHRDPPPSEALLGSTTRRAALSVAGSMGDLARGAALTALGLFFGFAFAFDYTDLDPGRLDIALATGLLVASAIGLMIHAAAVRGNRVRITRALAACALFQVPFMWSFLFRPQFDAKVWKSSHVEGRYEAGEMAEDLVYSRMLLSKTRSEVEEILGPPTSGSQVMGYNLSHSFGCRGFNVLFRGDRCTDVVFYGCD